MRPVLLLTLVFACKSAGGAASPAHPTGALILVSLENGDRACYVHLRAADGTEVSHEGDFELCPGAAQDASKLVGKRVRITTKQANVLAASCEGNVDCGKSDVVDLVTTITEAN